MDSMAVVKGSKLLKALGNRKRLEIMYLLQKKECKVGDLETKIGLSQSALSQHLAILRTAGIVATRRQAQSIFYSIKNENALKLLQLLDKMYNR